MDIFDVLIIGAGPGGSKAAIECLNKGLSVLIVEKKKTPGLPVHCGECISEFAFSNTSVKPPENTISNRVKGVRVTFPGNHKTFLGDRGVVLNKDIFEQWLFEEAVKKGASFRLKARVTDLKKSGSNWQIRTDNEIFRSKVVIDASGVSAVANRLLKINKPFTYTTGLQYEIEGDFESDIIDFYLWPEYTEHGYIWVIPKGDNRFNVGLLSKNGKDLQNSLNRFVANMGFSNNIIKKAGGRMPSSGPLKKTYSDGLIFIGDAAGFTSPLFEGGTHLALKSACFAADAVINFLKRGKDLKGYQRRWRRSFPKYDRILGGKRKLYGLENNDMERLGGYLPEDVTYHSVFDKIISGSKMFFNDRDLIYKGSIDIMRAFEGSKAQNYGW